jgi:hypothetical protein
MLLILKISGGDAGLMILGIFWFRMLAVVYPYVFTEWIKLKPGLRKVRRPGRLNRAYKIGLTAGVGVALFLFPVTLNTEIDIYDFNNLQISVDPNETARLVDLNMIGIYQLPMQGMVLSTSQYFHEQQNLIYNKSKYLSMLKENNISYVIYCQDCLISNISYEKKFLEQEFNVVYSDEEYVVYDTKCK